MIPQGRIPLSQPPFLGVGVGCFAPRVADDSERLVQRVSLDVPASSAHVAGPYVLIVHGSLADGTGTLSLLRLRGAAPSADDSSDTRAQGTCHEPADIESATLEVLRLPAHLAQGIATRTMVHPSVCVAPAYTRVLTLWWGSSESAVSYASRGNCGKLLSVCRGQSVTQTGGGLGGTDWVKFPRNEMAISLVEVVGCPTLTRSLAQQCSTRVCTRSQV